MARLFSQNLTDTQQEPIQSVQIATEQGDVSTAYRFRGSLMFLHLNFTGCHGHALRGLHQKKRGRNCRVDVIFSGKLYISPEKTSEKASRIAECRSADSLHATEAVTEVLWHGSCYIHSNGERTMCAWMHFGDAVENCLQLSTTINNYR